MVMWTRWPVSVKAAGPVGGLPKLLGVLTYLCPGHILHPEMCDGYEAIFSFVSERVNTPQACKKRAAGGGGQAVTPSASELRPLIPQHGLRSAQRRQLVGPLRRKQEAGSVAQGRHT